MTIPFFYQTLAQEEDLENFLLAFIWQLDSQPPPVPLSSAVVNALELGTLGDANEFAVMHLPFSFPVYLRRRLLIIPVLCTWYYFC